MKEYSGLVAIGIISSFNCYILYRTTRTYSKLDRTLDRIIEVKNVIEKNIEKQEEIKKINNKLLSNINAHIGTLRHPTSRRNSVANIYSEMRSVSLPRTPTSSRHIIES